MAGMRWEVCEHEIYSLCVSQIGGAKFVDKAIAALVNALSLNPQGFPPAGVPGIRIAKTQMVFSNGQIVPALSLRFRIIPPHTVELLHIEISSPDEMEFGDDFIWD
jgi:hypothetical protein